MGSIRRHLLAYLLAALGLGGVVLVVVSYQVTLEELSEVFNENLKQVALAVAHHHPASDLGAPRKMPQLPRFYEEEGEFDYVTLIWTPQGQLLATSDPDVKIDFVATSGLSVTQGDGHRWHVYSIVTPERIVQAAQRFASREELAAATAAHLILPMVVLMAVLASLLILVLRRGLQPLDDAARDIAKRSAASLEMIPAGALPREIRPLIESINALMKRLGDALSQQRQFVADAAHELRTPVTALRLQTQLIEQARDEPGRKAAVQRLRSGVERAQRLIEQLLQLSRVEPQAYVLKLERVALHELARSAVEQFSLKAEHREIDLGADVRDELWVQADRAQLTILLNNLVENALRYTPAGGVVDVGVAASDDGRASLTVTDTGPGIPREERPRVFDRFHRGEHAPSGEEAFGSGLGLSIVKAIADRHGATVALLDAPGGHGLAVAVTFTAMAASMLDPVTP